MIELKGKKIEMGQVFGKDGGVIPITLIGIENKANLGEIRPGAPVITIGVSKGKGFTGVMKRWGFAGGPATHGQSDRARAPGSIGGTTTPGRVYKGKKMAGRAGGQRVTVKGLKVVEVDAEAGIIKVSGPVPGARNSKLVLKIVEESQ